MMTVSYSVMVLFGLTEFVTEVQSIRIVDDSDQVDDSDADPWDGIEEKKVHEINGLESKANFFARPKDEKKQRKVGKLGADRAAAISVIFNGPKVSEETVEQTESSAIPEKELEEIKENFAERQNVLNNLFGGSRTAPVQPKVERTATPVAMSWDAMPEPSEELLPSPEIMELEKEMCELHEKYGYEWVRYAFAQLEDLEALDSEHILLEIAVEHSAKAEEARLQKEAEKRAKDAENDRLRREEHARKLEEERKQKEAEASVVDDAMLKRHGWAVLKCPKGNTYYHHKKDNKTQWDKPEVTDWVEYKCKNTGKSYFYNSFTKETKWDAPARFVAHKK